MNPNTETTSNYYRLPEGNPGSDRRRLPKDFITPSIGDKAEIIEVRQGSSPPVQYSTSFVWPSSSPICFLEYDSRNIKPGTLYFALPGLHTNGHKYIPEAVKKGAATVVFEEELPEYDGNVLYIRVRDSRFAMSPLSAAFYDFPSRRMGIIGVTGTEGKSTTVYFIYQLLKLLGKKAGFISTVMHGDGLNDKANSEHQTTPEAPIVHRLLAEMYNNGAEYAVLESSSHGLSKKTNRLGDVDFDVGVLTNVTHEHLEFHGTFEQYRQDKAELFRALDVSIHKKQGRQSEYTIPSFGVANADDPSAAFFAAATDKRTYTFSTTGAEADVSSTILESRSDGNVYEVLDASTWDTFEISDNLNGAFNAGNVLAALITVAKLFSIEVKVLKNLVTELKPVRGRMNSIKKGQPFELLIDYAHTPSSFNAIFPPLRKRLDSTGGRLISLFGSPGERDTKKRSLQGEIAARYSDIVILADEDPRGEDPMAILEEIEKGCLAEPRMIRNETLFLIPNRMEAIRKAFSLAQKGDIVILLGKSHENSIIYADGPTPYDEFEAAEKALSELGFME